MSKQKLFSLKSVLTSAKGIVSSIVTGITTFLFILLARYFIEKQMYAVGGIIVLFTFVWYLFFWGYISYRFWDW